MATIEKIGGGNCCELRIMFSKFSKLGEANSNHNLDDKIQQPLFFLDLMHVK